MLRKGDVVRWISKRGNKYVQPGDILVVGDRAKSHSRLIWATCLRTGFKGTTYIEGPSMEVIGHAESR